MTPPSSVKESEGGKRQAGKTVKARDQAKGDRNGEKKSVNLKALASEKMTHSCRTPEEGKEARARASLNCLP